VGGVANLFLELAGIDPGPPSVAVIENELGAAYAASRAQAERLLETHRDQIRIPSDVAINKEGVRVDISIDKLPSEFPIWDLGIGSSQVLTDAIMGAGTMIVNGPAGVFESDAFAFGTIEILNALAESEGVSIIGGGHTSALVVQRGLSSRMGHVSTGGGACLDILSGAPMPACEALERSKSEFGARLDELGLT
jgi:phosphoglycerate kinase